MTLTANFSRFTKAIGAALSPEGFSKVGPGYLAARPGALVGCQVNSRKWSTPDCKRFSITLGVWWEALDAYRPFPPQASGWPGSDADRLVVVPRPAGVAGEDELWEMDAATDPVALGVAARQALHPWLTRLAELTDLDVFQRDLEDRTARAETVTIEHVKLLRVLVERAQQERARQLCAAWQDALPPAHYKREWIAGQLEEVLRIHASSAA